MINTKKLALAGIYIAIGVILSPLYIPIGISKCLPWQHMLNVLSAVTLGPVYGVLCAFAISIFRNIIATGTPLAFAGSMIGALLAGIVYIKTKKIYIAALGEIIGTGIIGGLLSYPIAKFLLGNTTATWYFFVIPFSVNTVAGSIIGYLFLIALIKATKGLILGSKTL